MKRLVLSVLAFAVLLSCDLLGGRDNRPPTPGQGPSPVAMSATSIAVSWTAATDNLTPPENLIYVAALSLSSAGAISADSLYLATLNGVDLRYTTGQTEFVFENLRSSTTYYINVVCRDERGNEAGYSEASITTPTDLDAPTVSGPISFSGVTQTSLTVHWPQAMDAETPQSELAYRLVMSTDSTAIDTVEEVEAAADSLLKMDWDIDATRASIYELQPHTTYYFAAAVRDGTGNAGFYAPQACETVTELEPPIPTGALSISAIGETGFTVSWPWAIDNHTPFQQIRYRVVVSEDPTAIDTVAEAENAPAAMEWAAGISSFAVSGLNPYTNYSVVVVAHDSIGNGALYASAPARTLPHDVMPPVFEGPITLQNGYLMLPRASDEFTSDSELLYRLVWACSGDQIDTVAEAELLSDNHVPIDWAQYSGYYPVMLTPAFLNRSFAVLAKDTYQNTSLSPVLQITANDIARLASDRQSLDAFGYSVSISGNYAIVGADTEDGGAGDPASNCGAAYIFERDADGIWSERAILHASDRQASDYFGWSVSISGNHAVVGACGEDGGAGDPASSCGAAYIFERNGSGVWSERAILRASDLQANDNFGHSVSISGNAVIVCADTEDGGALDPASNCGAAYIFERNGSGVWSERAILHASDRQTLDRFGHSVAISGSYAVVGADSEDGGFGDPSSNCGAVYVFERDAGGIWSESDILYASDRQASDYFGWSVSISYDSAIVGSIMEDGGSGDPVANCGAVYIFERDAAGIWSESAALHASDRQASDSFGGSVSISGDYAIVGAYAEDGGAGNPAADCGAAYVFERDAARTWSECAILHAADLQAGDYFGCSVSLSGNLALAGAYAESGGAGNPTTGCGAAYFY